MTIPATLFPVEQIFMETQQKQCRSICITACDSGDGVTSVAAALTERFLLAGYSTLLVDLNLNNPAFHNSALVHKTNDELTHWIEHHKTHHIYTGVTVPNQTSSLIAYRDPDFLKNSLNKWLATYDRIVIDTSPILHATDDNIPANTVALACDATLLVVRTGHNTSSQLAQASAYLDNDQIQLLGTILNTYQQPSLGQEMVRELKRIPFIPTRWRKKLNHYLLTSPFLNYLT